MRSKLLNLLPARSEKGQVIVLMALMLVGLIGAAALVVDGGRAYGERRSVQNAADNAALAAAWALCQTSPGDHVAAARDSAEQNGFKHGVDGVSVTVFNGPASGPNAGDSEYVEVVVNAQWQPSFMQVLTSNNDPITSSTRAVARCVPGSGGGPAGWGNGLIALHPTNHNVVEGPSSGCLHVTGGGVFVNSSHAGAVFLDGGDGGSCPGGARVAADWVQVVGNVSLPSWVVPYGNPSLWIKPWPPQTGELPREDPLATLVAPSPPAQPGAAAAPSMGGCSSNPYVNGHLNLNNGYDWCTSSITVYPGTYKSFNVTSSPGVPVTMQPGLYYISEGNFSVTGPGSGQTLTGSGVTIVVASGDAVISSSARVNFSSGSSGVLYHVQNGNFTVGGDDSTRTLAGLIYVHKGSISIDGSSALTTTAPSSGPYAGLAFFMGRTNTNNFTVGGAGVLSMTGTIYAPDARIASVGSGSNKTVNGQMIANRFHITGGGSLSINYDDDLVFGGGGGGPSKIELSE